MTCESVVTERIGDLLTVRLNRPEVHNAMDECLMADLTSCMSDAAADGGLRAVVITGVGRSFCAGADLNWMKGMVDRSREESVEDSRRLLRLFDSIHDCPVPVIARINGPAFGGGLGIIACCDITLASPDTLFAFSEARIGIIPSVISSYVVRRIGPANMKRLFMTAERFDARHGKEIGLIDHLLPPEELDAGVETQIKHLRHSGPGAVREVKAMLRAFQEMRPDEYREYTVETIARLRASPEGQEGLRSFLEKKRPSWSDA